MRFLHIADIHLGYEQYGSHERFNDFSRAFLWLMQFANEQKVDFVLLAGDLFHKRVVDPLAMRVAVSGFSMLQAPIYAIEGNHEKAHFADQKSWVDYLHETGRITALDRECISLDGAQICGIKYAGAETDPVAQSFMGKIDSSGEFTILMLHAGLEGQIAHAGNLSAKTVDKLREKVNYLALGHIHKPYQSNGVFNPGSPENVSSDEVLWPHRGALLVDVGSEVATQVVVPPRRMFHRFDVNLDGADSPDVLLEAADYLCTLIEGGDAPVVDVLLSGEVQFARAELDIDGAKQILGRANPLLVHIRNQTVPTGFNLSIDSGMSKIDLEHTVLERVIRRDARFREEAPQWANIALGLKDAALSSSAEEVMRYAEGALTP